MNELTLTESELAEMRRVKSYFPYRITYGAIRVTDKREFVASAVTTKRIPNKLLREGWTVYLLEVQHNGNTR